MAVQDCIVIGGGPAGLTAALYLARFLRTVTVLDDSTGRAGMIPRTHNLAPFPEGITGRDLLDRMHTHAVRYGATICNTTARGIHRQGDLFHVKTDTQSHAAPSLIFACGVFNLRPPLPQDVHDKGLARGLIRYCPVCDAYEIRNKRIAVLGNGTHGRNEARFISHFSPAVTLIPTDRCTSTSADAIAVLNAPMFAVSLTEEEVIITLETGQTHHYDTLYVALGTRPNSDLAVTLQVKCSLTGHITVDAKQRTNVKGLFAIGDVTDGLDQIAIAMGQAAVAATAIHNDALTARTLA